MQILSRLLLYLGVLAVLTTGALRGAGYFLSQGGAGDELSALLSRHWPNVTVHFSAAEFRLSWRGVWLRVRDFQLDDRRGAGVRAQTADFWLNNEQVNIVLHRPQVHIIRRQSAQTDGKSEVGVVLPAGGRQWALQGEEATLHLQDDIRGLAVTLQNSRFVLTGKDNRLRLNAESLDEQRRGKFIAEVDSRTGNGEAYLAVDRFSPPDAPWRDAAMTVWATIGETTALAAAGHFSSLQFSPFAAQTATIAAVQWRATTNFSWPAAGLTVALSLVAEDAALAGAPPLTAAAGGEWRLPRLEKPDWRLTLTAIAVNPDGIITAAGTLAGAGGRVTNTQLDGTMADMDLGAIERYFPPGEVRQWFADSLPDGITVDATFALRGDMSQFPFRAGGGEVLLTAVFDRGRLHIADGFPPAEQLAGVLVLRNDDIDISGEGAMSGLTATNVQARIHRFMDDDASTLELDILFAPAPIARYLTAAQLLPPTAAAATAAGENFSLQAEGMLTIALTVPLTSPQDTRMLATLHIFDGVLTAPHAPTLTAVNGVLHLDNDTVRGAAGGDWAGHHLTLHLHNDDFVVHGAANADSLLALAGGSERIPARGAVRFTLRVAPKMTLFAGDLTAAEILLPAPLGKKMGDSAFLTVRQNNDGIAIAGQNGRNRFHAVYENEHRFDIAVNSPSLPAMAGGRIHGTAVYADIDGWLAIIGEAGDGANFPPAIVDLTLHQSLLTGRRQNAVLWRQRQDSGRWILDGISATGTVTMDGGQITADLRHLSLPGGLPSSNAFLRNFALSADIGELTLGGKKIGQTAISGAPGEDGEWRLHRLTATDGDNRLTVSGGIARGEMRLSVSLSAPDLPRLFDNFALTGTIMDGGAVLDGELTLPNADFDFALDQLGGSLRLQGRDLRYLKTSPGVLQLLSIFSFESLFSLGFTELGKEGLVLEHIDGRVDIKDGIAHSEELRLENRDLIITMAGDADMVREKFNIRGRVRPGGRIFQSGSVVTAIGTGGGSVLAGFLFGKVFKDPISEIGAYDYTISGDWDNPVYTEIGASLLQLPPKPNSN